MTSVIEAALSLSPRIKARAPEIEKARRLPADIARTLADAGFFRMLVPESVGGLEVTAATFSDAVMKMAAADAAVGWCVMIGATTGLNSAYLPLDSAKEIFGDPSIVTGGVFAPIGRAVVDGDHYRVTGRWPWASGSANCDWLGGGCIIYEGEQPRRRPDGAPDSRMLMFPRSDVELIDTWEASGLRGTGSGDIAVNDIKVPINRAVSLLDAPVAQGPLFAFPVFGLLAVGVASVALGNAQAALESIQELASAKKPQYSRRSLAERSTVQAEFARASGRWRAARAYLDDAIDRCWTHAVAQGTLDIEARADLRLACTHASRESADIARAAYDLGGGTSVYAKHPLQRHFRDAHVATQHVMVAPSTYELIGRVQLGLETQSAML